jgi:hypothetical protein
MGGGERCLTSKGRTIMSGNIKRVCLLWREIKLQDASDKVAVTNCLVEFRQSIEGRVWHRECIIQAQVSHLLSLALLGTGSVTTLISETYFKLNAAFPKLVLLAFVVSECIRHELQLLGYLRVPIKV